MPLTLLSSHRARNRPGEGASRVPSDYGYRRGHRDCHRSGGAGGKRAGGGLRAAAPPMVIRSRPLDGSVVEARSSAVRRAGAATFRALARQIVPDATDTQCGFKFFSGPLARAAALPLRTAGFAFDVELIARCQRLGATL